MNGSAGLWRTWAGKCYTVDRLVTDYPACLPPAFGPRRRIVEVPMSRRIDRRPVLKGLGAAVALPWLEAMAPLATAAPAGKLPLRAAFLYVPHGAHTPDRTPQAAGAPTA